MALTKVKAGNIILTTPAASSNDVTPATTQYVTTALANLADSAPSTLNTLNELAAALGDDANFSTTVTNSIATKLPLAGGSLTGSLDISGGAVNGTSFADNRLLRLQNTSTTDGSRMGIAFQGNSSIGSGLAWIEGVNYDQSIGATDIRFSTYSGSAWNTDMMTLSNNGNVGIGITSPATTLHLDASGGAVLRMQRTSANATNKLELSHDGTNGSISSTNNLTISAAATTFNSTALIQGVSNYTGLEVKGSGGSRPMLKFTNVNNGNLAGIYGTEANAMVLTSGSSNTAQMVIESGGNIGIGYGSPGQKLQIAQAANYAPPGLGNNGGHFGIFKIDTGVPKYGMITGVDSSGKVWQQVQRIDSQATAYDLLLQPSGGKVGIGTTSPGAKLEISGKDDEGASDLLRLQFDNSPADTGITFTDINSTIKNRITMDASNTSDLHISASSQMKFFCGTTGTSTAQVMALKKINSTISTVHAGYGVIGPSSDITVRAQGSGENWRWGSNVSNSHSYWLNSSSVGVYMVSGQNYWTAHSDERIKENITPLGEVLPSLKNMRCVKFNRKGSSVTQIGFIAQDWEGKGFDEILDEDTAFTIQDDGTLKSVVEEDNTSTVKPKSMAYEETIPLLLKAIQELEARITTLEG